MMKKIIILFWSLTLFGCNSQLSIDEKTNSATTANLSQAQKLANRKDKWNADRKCLKAIAIKSDMIDSLCSNSQDVYTLAHEGGLYYAEILVDSQLKILNTYQKELDEGLHNKIPSDKLEITEARQELNEYVELALESSTMFDEAQEKYIQEKSNRMVAALETYEKNYRPLP